jgi:hypothetical protein
MSERKWTLAEIEKAFDAAIPEDAEYWEPGPSFTDFESHLNALPEPKESARIAELEEALKTIAEFPNCDLSGDELSLLNWFCSSFLQVRSIARNTLGEYK